MLTRLNVCAFRFRFATDELVSPLGSVGLRLEAWMYHKLYIYYFSHYENLCPRLYEIAALDICPLIESRD